MGMHDAEMDDAPEDMRGLRGKYRHTEENKRESVRFNQT